MWLRLYTDILNNPKVQLLAPDQFKGWVNLLCLAKEHDGVLPSLRDMAFRLRTTEAEIQRLCNELTNEGLLDYTELGWKPHNWDEHQYDTSTERMRRHRQKQRDATVTASDKRSGVTCDADVTSSDADVTPRYRADTEQIQSTETETDMSGADAPRVAVLPEIQTVFAYWQAALNHPQAKLTTERKKKIQARLTQGYSVEQIQTAIDGCRASPYHMGQNENGTVYDDIELICRNGSKLESFISKVNQPTGGSNGRNQVPHRETHNERAARELDELIQQSLAPTGGNSQACEPDTGGAWIAADFCRT